MIGTDSMMGKRRVRVMGAIVLAWFLASGIVHAQSDAPRLEFRTGEGGSEESSEPPPRSLPPIAFSPLTPREPPPMHDEAPVRPVIYDQNVIPAVASSVEPTTAPRIDANIQQAGCTSCGSGRITGLGGHGSGGLLSGGCASGNCGRMGCSVCGSGPRPGCVPGREPFCGWHNPGEGKIHRFIGGLYECLCCPDPCYDPRWIPLADTAFHVASARPITHNRFRWNHGANVILADRAEFFWARQDGNGKGPRPTGGRFVYSERFDYNDLIYYFEAGTGTAAVVVETPYRSIDPPDAPHSAGFADLKVGPKTLLFDCELLQIGMQMLTYIPAGNAAKGLGTGHVSLEPSLLIGLKLGPSTYYQGQLSEWIPLGGDPDYAGAVLHTHHALNHVLYRCPGADIQLIGTAELHTWSFQDGAYTDPILGPLQPASGNTYVMVGTGFRVFVCDKVDFGFSASFSITDEHLPAQLYTSEFRIRF